MRSRSLPLLLAALLAPPLAAGAELAFPVPPGWLDLSPGAPEENFRKVAPEFASRVRGQHLRACAVALGETEEGFTPSFNAVLLKGNARITEEKVDEAAAAILESLRGSAPGARLVEKGIVEVSGVSALRIVYDAEYGGRELRQMAVVVPGVPESAVVTYSALRTRFAALRDTFDAHAASIRGAEEAGLLARMDWWRALRAGGIGAVVGGAVVALALVLKRRAT